MGPRIHILTTGGTIDKIYFDAKSKYQVGEPQIVEILRNVRADVVVSSETVFRKDSLDLTDEDRDIICARVLASEVDKIIITHGTDTMVETARALGHLEDKTVVLVGSLTPAQFRVTDAEFNIGFALAAVQTLARGVYIAMNGRVFDPSTVRKNLDENKFEVDRS